MTNEQMNQQVQQEPATQESQVPQVDQQLVEKKAEELYQARNFKILREQAEAIARENAELKRRLEQNNPKRSESFDIKDDDLVEGRHLAQYKAYIDQKAQETEQKLQQYTALMEENFVKAQCPDFYEVVTEENLHKLAKEYPEVASTINSSSDNKAKAVAAYKLIKKFEIHNPQMQSDKDLVAKNAMKPKSSNTIPTSETDLSRVNAFERGMTDAEKEAKWKQMREYAKNYR